MSIKWSDEQLEAIERLKAFLSSREQVIVLTGFAGTGKSSIIKELISYIESKYIDYRLCAPTHKAKLVLQQFTNRNAITLHSLLKLAPNLNILRLDFADLQFNSSGTKEIPYKGLIIVDEASMISDDLYDLLIEYCTDLSTKIIFIGDIAQLQPVKKGDVSKVFKNDNIIRLTKIFRQTDVNELSNLLIELRDHYKEDFTQSSDNSILTYRNTSDFVSNVLKDIKTVMETKDLNYAKLICYTNKRINAYNKAIRKLLYSDNEPYHIGELLVGCENYSNSIGDFYNSSDYIVTNIVREQKYLPNYGSVFGYTLTLFDGELEQGVFMIDESEIISELALVIETLRIEAIQSKGKARYLKWSKYYDLVKSFATPINIIFQDRVIKPKTFNYGYAISSHKSQGSSYNIVYIDMKNLLLCSDEQELRQLQYVALSRTRTNVNLLI